MDKFGHLARAYLPQLQNSVLMHGTSARLKDNDFLIPASQEGDFQKRECCFSVHLRCQAAQDRTQPLLIFELLVLPSRFYNNYVAWINLLCKASKILIKGRLRCFSSELKG